MFSKNFRNKNYLDILRSTPALVLFSALVISFTFVVPKLAKADPYQNQINVLNQQNAIAQSNVHNLAGQAANYQQAIANLGAQVNGMQAAISVNQTKQATLETEIANNQAELSQQKSTLANVIKTMYVSGQLTPVEMLATSNNISQYIDQQTAYNAVQHKIQATVNQINNLQSQLQQQKQQLSVVLNIEKQQENKIASAQAQQQQLLSYNQSQQLAYNNQIQKNNSQIAALVAEQIAANRRLMGSGVVNVIGTCGGTYPAKAQGSYGPWGCDYTHSSDYQPGCTYLDSWGMCNRECVSYAAWMVYSNYGINVTGFGNANQWPSEAQAAGIPIGSTPKVGSIAIYMGGYGDPWGHAMWVKSINSNGSITVDQYNLKYEGLFWETTLSPAKAAGLVYIYFGS